MTTARCNPLWQPIPCPLSDIEGLESWLGDMAAQGLVPVTIGQNFARFRCSQPKAVRYRLNAKPAPETFLESAPGTPDGEERALAQECGWYYVTAVGDFFLYACEDSDAPELNTDPRVQALSLRYAKRQVFAPAGLLAYWLVTFWVRYAMGVWHTPVIDFVELGWLSFCYLGLLAAALVSVVHNTVLLYRFSARLTRGAEPERHKNWRKGAGRYLVGRVLAALLFVLTIVWTFAGSAMEKSRHGSIPLEDYTAPLPFATLDDYAGQPTALDADAARSVPDLTQRQITIFARHAVRYFIDAQEDGCHAAVVAVEAERHTNHLSDDIIPQIRPIRHAQHVAIRRIHRVHGNQFRRAIQRRQRLAASQRLRQIQLDCAGYVRIRQQRFGKVRLHGNRLTFPSSAVQQNQRTILHSIRFFRASNGQEQPNHQQRKQFLHWHSPLTRCPPRASPAGCSARFRRCP